MDKDDSGAYSVESTGQCSTHSETEIQAGGARRCGRDARTDADNRQADTMLRAIMRSIPIPLLVCSADGAVALYSNAAEKLCELLGAPDALTGPAGIFGASGLSLTDQSGLPLSAEDGPLARALRGESCPGTVVHAKSGSRLCGSLNMASAPLLGEDGEVTGAVLAATDVTEYVRAQEHIRKICRREHAIAEKLQGSFLPDGYPRIEGFEISDRYHAALDEALVGGDFYDLFRVDEGKLGIVMADVAGKGLKAAVYTAMTKYMLRAYALEESAPELVLARLNEALSACTPAEVFVTLVYGILDSRARTFIYANAGHEQPVLYSRRTGLAVNLDVTGRALALVNGASFTTCCIEMEPGDVVAMFTDGITDAGWGPYRLGAERVLGVVESHAGCAASVLADSLLSEALEFAGGKLADDVALLVVKALPVENNLTEGGNT